MSTCKVSYLYGTVWIEIIHVFAFAFFIFIFYQKHVNTAASARDLHHFQHPHIGPAMVLLVGLVYCSRDPQISLFSNFFIKNESHDTIHAFKNYFVTVFSVFSFSINKFNPNGPYISHSCLVFFFVLEELIKTVNYI